MTDKLKGCFVAFDRDIRKDDAVDIIEAIKMIKGVADVTDETTSPYDWMVAAKVKNELKEKLFNVFENS